jgi:DNA-binding Lrp family transcriptional regulator
MEPKRTDEVFGKIKIMKGITEAFMVYGEYDAAFVIQMESVSGIQDFIKSIRKLAGITRTVTLIEIV